MSAEITISCYGNTLIPNSDKLYVTILFLQVTSLSDARTKFLAPISTLSKSVNLA